MLATFRCPSGVVLRVCMHVWRRELGVLLQYSLSIVFITFGVGSPIGFKMLSFPPIFFMLAAVFKKHLFFVVVVVLLLLAFRF